MVWKFLKANHFSKGGKEKEKNKQIDKKGMVFLMRQEKSQAWLIPSFNYPAHLVSCDPGLWEVTTV